MSKGGTIPPTPGMSLPRSRNAATTSGTRVMCAQEHREPHDVNVLLDGRDRDALWRLEEPGVDDLHPGVAQQARHNLDAPVVPVGGGL
jgi:hypothetical protein